MRFLATILVCAALAACGDREGERAAQAAAATEAAAAKDASAYEQLVAAQSFELAQSIGHEVVRKYPQSQAAAKVKLTLADVDAKANARIDARRLVGLWAYQSGEQSGSEQHTASMYSLEPSGDAQVRLILRRHAAWGQSVYLHGGQNGFSCGKPCTLAAQFDDEAPVKLEASIPEGGEPAVFIEGDKAFLAKLDAAKRVTFQVDRKGYGQQKVVFEVGGYEPTKWAQLSK